MGIDGRFEIGILEMWKTVHAIEARRLVCEHCRQPYTYLVGENLTADATGMDVHSPHARTRIEAALLKQLRRVAACPRRGEAICPRCHCFQGWMVASSVRRQLVVCGSAGLLTALLLVASHASLVDAAAWDLAILYGILGVLAGLLVGRLRALRLGPHRMLPTPLVASDDALLERARAAGIPPGQALPDSLIIDWYQSARPETRDMGAALFLGWHHPATPGKGAANATPIPMPSSLDRLDAMARDGLLTTRDPAATA